MKILVTKDLYDWDQAVRDDDYEARTNYTMKAEFETDPLSEEFTVTVDDEIQMFVEALKLEGYHRQSIIRGLKRAFENLQGDK